MNFKTLFAVFSLALFGGLNAAPIDNEVPAIKKACQSTKGMTLIQMNDEHVSYACLNVYNEESTNNKVTPEDASCFYFKDQILCVNQKYSNIESCDKSSEYYNYHSCSYAIATLGSSEKNHLTFELKTYPDNDRVIFAPAQEQEDCEAENGLALSYGTIQQYICLTPFENKEDFLKYCVYIKESERVYCVDTSKTIFNFCDNKSAHFDHEYCYSTLKLYARVKGLTVEREA